MSLLVVRHQVGHTTYQKSLSVAMTPVSTNARVYNPVGTLYSKTLTAAMNGAASCSVLHPTIPVGATMHMTTTAIPLSPYSINGVSATQIFGQGKHYTFSKVGSRWYKMGGDHPKIDAGSPDFQGGRQEIVSADLSANDWREDQHYFLPDPGNTGKQQVFCIDDGWSVTRNGEIWCFRSIGNNEIPQIAPINPPPGDATIVDAVMAWTPGTGGIDTGTWRLVRQHINEYRGNRAWRAYYDSVTDRFIIPCVTTDLCFVVIDGATGADLTWRNAGVAQTWGPLDHRPCGHAVDPTTRTMYLYDTQGKGDAGPGLYKFNVDDIYNHAWSHGTPVLNPFPGEFVGNTQSTFKMLWHPTLHCVILSLGNFVNVYEPATSTLTQFAHQDGFSTPDSGGGPYHWPSEIFYDPVLDDVIAIGAQDFGATPVVCQFYWRNHFYKA